VQCVLGLPGAFGWAFERGTQEQRASGGSAVGQRLSDSARRRGREGKGGRVQSASQSCEVWTCAELPTPPDAI